MPRSVVNLAKLSELDAAIKTFGENTDVAMSMYLQSVSDLLVQFETKLAELKRIRNIRLAALNSCEYRRSLDDSISCAKQALAFYEADNSYSQCKALVKEAHNAVAEYKTYADKFQGNKDNLCSRASMGLSRVEDFVNEYNANATPETGIDMSNGGGTVSPSMTPTAEQAQDTSMGGSFMFITGGEQIERVLPKGSATDPIRIDPDSNKLEDLPPVVEPDKSTMRVAAAGILSILAAGGLLLGAREELLRQKTDEIFKSQYGISRIKLLLASGPKQKEYIGAYNNIYKGLQQEMKECQKEEIGDKLIEINNMIQKKSKEQDLLSFREVERLKIDQINLQNKKMTLEDGLARPKVPYDVPYIAGLSEKEMLYLMDCGKMSPGRYANTLLMLNQSDFSLVSDKNGIYSFNDGKTQLDITHDGSKISIITAFAGEETSSNAEITLGTVEQSSAHTWDAKKPKEIGRQHSITSSGAAISANMSYSNALNYREDWVSVNEDGAIISAGYNIKLGPEVSANAQASNMNAEDSVGVDIAKGEGRITASTRPTKIGRGVYQGAVGVSGGGTLGASAVGELGWSEKGAKAKVGASALLKATVQGNVRKLSIDKLPTSVADRLSESLPTMTEVISDNITRAGMIDYHSPRIKQ